MTTPRNPAEPYTSWRKDAADQLRMALSPYVTRDDLDGRARHLESAVAEALEIMERYALLVANRRVMDVDRHRREGTPPF